MLMRVFCLSVTLIVCLQMQVSASVRPEPTISENAVLADVNQVRVRLVTPTAGTSSSAALLAQIGKTLRAQGIESIDGGAGPSLRIRIETVSVEGSGHTVYRVGTVLNQIVTLTGRRPRRVRADVWRLPPAMKAVPDVKLNDAVVQTVLMQVEMFATTCRAARDLAKRAAPADGSPVPGPRAPQQGVDTPRGSVTEGPVVASKSSSVFHRPDCRWAQNIAEQNRVTYKSRAEAIKAGKRPCKSCKP